MPRRTDPGAPIVMRSYDLCAELYQHINRFPRAQRGLLGRVILDEGLRMLAALALANRLADKTEALSEASGHLDALRIALRLATRLTFLPKRAYAALSETIDEVGRMLGGWLKHEQAKGQATSLTEPAAPPAAEEKEKKRPRSGKGGVRFTMTSPMIERYLAAKLAHPGALVLVTAGAFCQTFFEDAKFMHTEFKLKVRDLAADSEPEKIPACGVPKTRLDYWTARIERAGYEVHVE